MIGYLGDDVVDLREPRPCAVCGDYCEFPVRRGSTCVECDCEDDWHDEACSQLVPTVLVLMERDS